MAGSTDLGRQVEDYVAELVRTGRYGSRGDVLREGVRLVEERERRLAALDAAIARGVADADAGKARPVDEVAGELASRFEQMAAERGV